MARKSVLIGVLYLAGIAVAGVIDVHRAAAAPAEVDKAKEPEKKPNFVKDYICLRDGELCHPEFGKNRGLYVSCSNGVAWEQKCPPCSYHPLNCPTKTLWFDGEKCNWASPKLASSPCVDHIPVYNSSLDKYSMSEQEALLQSLLVKEPVSAEQNNWQAAAMPMHLKSPKSGDLALTEPEPVPEEVESINNLVAYGEESPEKEVLDTLVAESSSAEESNNEEAEDVDKRKADHESEFPSYMSAEDAIFGNKIVRLSDPVYTLVDNPDGSGKQVLMRVAQPFVLEDPGRSILPNINVLGSFSNHKD